MWGKLRMGLELLVPPRRNGQDESLGGFVRRRLGRQALEGLAEPLLAGIYAADPDQLSLLATFPGLQELERRHGSLIAASRALRRRRAAHAQPGRSPFMTLRGGLGMLIKALTIRFSQVTVLTGQRVAGLSYRQERAAPYYLRLANGQSVEANTVVLATPAYVTAKLLEQMSPEATELLAGIPYVSTAVVTLAFRHREVEHPLDGTGFVVPRIEGRALTACTWSSSKWAGRAPEGFALLRCFFGRAGQEEIVKLDDEGLLCLAYEQLHDLLGLHGEPVLSRVQRWPQALPQYLVGHLDRLGNLEAALSDYPGLLLAGAAYRGIGLPDCIFQGAKIAAAYFSA